MAEPFPQHMNPVDQAPTLFRVLHLGNNGKQDWHGIRRCPHTASIELVAVEDADCFSSRSQAENFRKQYEYLHGGSRTVIREVTFAVGEALPKLAGFVAPFRDWLDGYQPDELSEDEQEALAELDELEELHNQHRRRLLDQSTANKQEATNA